MSLRLRTLGRLIAPVCALGLLAGCTPASTAFSINGVSVSERTVTTTTESCLRALGIPAEAAGLNRLPSLNNLIMGVLGDQIAMNENLTVTDAEATAAIPAEAQGQLGDPGCKSMTEDFGRYVVVLDKVGPEKVLAYLREYDVKVNPRYGVFDPEQGQVPRGGTGSLSSTSQTYGS